MLWLHLHQLHHCHRHQDRLQGPCTPGILLSILLQGPRHRSILLHNIAPAPWATVMQWCHWDKILYCFDFWPTLENLILYCFYFWPIKQGWNWWPMLALQSPCKRWSWTSSLSNSTSWWSFGFAFFEHVFLGCNISQFGVFDASPSEDACAALSVGSSRVQETHGLPHYIVLICFQQMFGRIFIMFFFLGGRVFANTGIEGYFVGCIKKLGWLCRLWLGHQCSSGEKKSIHNQQTQQTQNFQHNQQKNHFFTYSWNQSLCPGQVLSVFWHQVHLGLGLSST